MFRHDHEDKHMQMPPKINYGMRLAVHFREENFSVLNTTVQIGRPKSRGLRRRVRLGVILRRPGHILLLQDYICPPQVVVAELPLLQCWSVGYTSKQSRVRVYQHLNTT